ncbi:unnamed protein product, partial [Symbiodinium pilosum]
RELIEAANEWRTRKTSAKKGDRHHHGQRKQKDSEDSAQLTKGKNGMDGKGKNKPQGGDSKGKKGKGHDATGPETKGKNGNQQPAKSRGRNARGRNWWG